MQSMLPNEVTDPQSQMRAKSRHPTWHSTSFQKLFFILFYLDKMLFARCNHIKMQSGFGVWSSSDSSIV